MHFKLGLIVVAAFLAVQVSATDLEDRAAQLIEDFRSIMPTGLPDINIPVLEPAVVKTLPVNIKLSPFEAKVIASNINIAGVSAFKFNRISQIVGTNKLAIEVEVPAVNVDGAYGIDGHVKIGFVKVKLNGEGPLTLNIYGIKAQATVDVLINADGSLNVSQLKVDSWTYDSIKIQLDNLFNGGVMGKTVNKLINKLVPKFINSIHSKIDQIAETVGMTVINRYLNGVTGKPTVRLLAAPHIFVNDEITVQNLYVSAEAQAILDQLALVAAGSVSLSTDLEARVAELVEEFRSTMSTGRPDIGIPVLEPAVIDRLPISVKLSPFDAKAIATNLQIAGVSAFEFTKISQIEGTNKLAVAVELPEVDVTGQYDLDGNVKMGFFKVALKGHGPLTLTIKGLKGTATADVLVHDDGSLNLNTLQIDSWTYDEIKIQLDNLFNGAALEKTVNALVNKLVPTFVNMNWSKINEMAVSMGTPLINRFLDGVAGKARSTFGLLSAPARPAPRRELVLEVLDGLAVPAQAQAILDQLALLVMRARLAADA